MRKKTNLVEKAFRVWCKSDACERGTRRKRAWGGKAPDFNAALRKAHLGNKIPQSRLPIRGILRMEWPISCTWIIPFHWPGAALGGSGLRDGCCWIFEYKAPGEGPPTNLLAAGFLERSEYSTSTTTNSMILGKSRNCSEPYLQNGVHVISITGLCEDKVI